MAKLTLSNIVSGYKARETINTNNDAIEAAVENTLSRDGTSPNQMEASLDMNDNTILNLPDGVGDQEPATMGQLREAVFGDASALIPDSFDDLAGSVTSAQGGIEIVGALPTVPDADYPEGAIVFLTTDDKLYRSTGATWTTAVATVDLSGTINLDSQVSGTLSTAFAEAGLINGNVTINANGTLSGAGAGQVNLAGLGAGDLAVLDTITVTEISDNAVTTPKINALAITAEKIATDAVTADKIIANAVTSTKINALAVTTAKLDALAVTTDKLAANAVTAAKITAGTITATELASDSVTTNKIEAGAVTAAKLAVSQLSAISADLGAVTAGTIVLPSGGYVRSGQTAYDTGTGFYLGNDSSTPRFSIGNASGNKLTWNGTTLAFTGALTSTNTVQTFTPSWTGFSSAPTGDMSYIDFGSYVIMYSSAGFSGTSNDTTMTITGIPSGIRPAATRVSQCLITSTNVFASSINTPGQVVIQSGGDMVFSIFKVQRSSSPQIYAGDVPDSGTGELLTGPSWSAVRNDVGDYVVTHNLNLTDSRRMIVTATPIWAIGTAAVISTQTVNSFRVLTFDGGGATDAAFSFVAVNYDVAVTDPAAIASAPSFFYPTGAKGMPAGWLIVYPK